MNVTRKTDAPTIERLDRSKPPPYWTATADRMGGCAIVKDSSGSIMTPGSAWVRHEKLYDPPGLQVFVWPREKASDPPTAWCFAPRGQKHVADFEGEDGEAKARAAAWAHYWRCEELAECLLNQEIGDFWPDILAWSDEQLANVKLYLVLWEDWAALRRDDEPKEPMPEVLRGPGAFEPEAPAKGNRVEK